MWRRRLCWLFPLLGFVLSVCYLTWLVETEKAQIETQFSAEAYSTLMSLNHSQLRVFNGTPAERDRPDYDRLHDQLAEIADMHPDWSRCFILKKRVNGDIYFFMDVKPSAQSEVSLPYGEVYTWCPAEIANVFSKPAGVMIGPYEDAYGTWVTALSPHVDPERGNVLCVVGIDMKASAYYLIVFKAVLPWACLCAVLLMILIFWGFFDHRRITLIRPSSSYSALITFVVGVGISLMFFHAFRQIDDSRIRLAFTSLASQKAQKVVSDISTFRSVELKHFEHAVLSMRNYSQEDFDTQFAEVAIIPRKRFWAWAPRVADSYPLTLFSDERVFYAFGALTGPWPI